MWRSKKTIATFHNPPFIFPLGKCVSQKRKNHFYTNTPCLIISPKRTSLMPILPNPPNPKSKSNPKQATNPTPHLGVPDRQNLRFQQELFTATHKSHTNRSNKTLHRSPSSIRVQSVFRPWRNSKTSTATLPHRPQPPMPPSFTSHFSPAPIRPAPATHSAYQPTVKNPQPKNSLVGPYHPAPIVLPKNSSVHTVLKPIPRSPLPVPSPPFPVPLSSSRTPLLPNLNLAPTLTPLPTRNLHPTPLPPCPSRMLRRFAEVPACPDLSGIHRCAHLKPQVSNRSLRTAVGQSFQPDKCAFLTRNLKPHLSSLGPRNVGVMSKYSDTEF